ncbi:phospholipase-like protein, partial [Tanacetum coccineum]
VETTEILQHNLPPTEQNLWDFTLLCTISNFNFYAMVDLGASINVMPKGIFDFLKVTNLRKTNMFIEMVDMTKKAPLGVVENVLVGIDTFLFPFDFVIIDRTPNETVILGRPFLTTIRAEIHVFDKKITLGVDNDRIIFDMDHNFMIPTERIHMVNLVSNKGPSHTPGNPSSKQLKIDNSQDRQEQQVKKKLRLDEKIHVKHFCKPIIQTYNGKVKMWPTCDPDKSTCDGGVEIYGKSRIGDLRIWGQLNDSTWGQSYAEWYKVNSHDNKPRPRDYSFKEWMIVKVGHINVNESVKKALLKSWVIDGFEEALDPDKDPKGRNFDDYKWVFDLEIKQLANEYELGIGKKGHMLEMIWENYKNIQGRMDHDLENDPTRNEPRRRCLQRNVPTARRKSSRDFTRPLGPPSGLKGLLHMLNATVIPTKVKCKYVTRNTGKGRKNEENADSYEGLRRNTYDSVTP